MNTLPDNTLSWVNDAIGYLDLVLDERGLPLADEQRRYLTNAKLLLQKITGKVP